MNTIITKLLSQLVGDGIVWKTLGAILIAAMSLAGLILKFFYDLDLKTANLERSVEHLTINNELLHKQLDESFKIVTQNQEIILKHNHLLVEEQSYWQYLTMRNVFYFTMAVGVVTTGIWLFNMDIFSTNTLESIKDLNNLVLKSTTENKSDVLTVLSEMTKKNQEVYENLFRVLNNILKIVSGYGEKTNQSLDKPVDVVAKLIEDDLT